MNNASPNPSPSVPAPGRLDTPLAQPGSVAGADPTQNVERELWTGRTSLFHFSGRFCLWLVFSIGLATLAWWLSARTGKITTQTAGLGWLAAEAIVTVILLFPAILSVLGQAYRLTSQRLFIARGILSKTVDQTELVRVDDVRVYQSLPNRIFGLGTVEILSTDMTDREISIVGVRDPHRVAEAIRANMRVTRKSTLFVENV